MSSRTVVIVVLALVFGGSAAVGVNILRSQNPGAATPTVQVVVAASDIPQASTLQHPTNRPVLPSGDSGASSTLAERDPASTTTSPW